MVQKVVSHVALLSLKMVTKREYDLLKLLNPVFRSVSIFMRGLDLVFCLNQPFLLDCHGLAKYSVLFTSPLMISLQRIQGGCQISFLSCQSFNHSCLLFYNAIKVALNGAGSSLSQSFQIRNCGEKREMR